MDASEAVHAVTFALGDWSSHADRLNAAAGVLSRLVNQNRVLEIINAVRSDSAMVTRCANESVRHPLGHDKIALIGSHPSFSLRLHAWWPDRNPGVEHIHHHRFGLATTVLRGHYEMELFQRAASGNRVIEYLQHSSADAREWYLAEAGVAHLQLKGRATIAQGSGYTLNADDLHRVLIPPGALCLTLFLAVIADSGLPTYTRVFTAPDSAAPTLVRATALTADGYRRVLDAIAMELDAG